ncbi:MAG: hypothetical protein CME65_14795 [Halobacteriovoraceae bacterium]|nr:hypothetical protein [Halobacteriovoraceae bacterium]
MPKLITLITCLLIVGAASAQDSSDGFSLDEFSEGLEVNNENIAPAKEEAKPESNLVEAAPEDAEYEKLDVTGSHIKRAGGQNVSPVMEIDRSMIEQAGYNSISDVLRDITASSFGGAREASGSSAAGVSSVNLRGLGSDKTLVLLNGKRLPVDAVTGSVDLNLIPMAAVKKVDVLLDGASATYGSDALGGVINIITHKDYNGTSVSYQQTFMSQFSGGATKQAEMITGSANARSSITTVLSYRENEVIFDRTRPWSEEAFSISGSPGSYIDDGGKWKPDTNNCPAGDIIDGGRGNEFCGYNYAAEASSVPALKQLNLMSLFQYEADNGITFYGRVNGTKKDVKWNYAPAPGVFSIPAATAATLGIPGYAGGDVTLRYRAVELGNRETEIDTYNLGFQTGMKGSVTGTWDWDLTFDRNTVYKNDLGVSGYGLTEDMQALIENGDFNPFDYGAGRGSLSSAAYQPWQLSRSENNFTELKFSGELFSTSHGAAGAAIGATHTAEKFSTQVDDLSANGKVFGSAGSNGAGERETRSFYVETIIPLAKSMEVQLAGRYDEFSDFGNTTNPKLGFSWNITKSLMVRASAGTGFKAPQLKDLYAAESDGFPTFIDEVACKAEQDAGGTTPSCNPNQWNVRSGGNAGLEEETAETYNIGIVFQPNPRNMIGIDVWQSKLSNVVDINLQQLTQYELDNGASSLQSNFGITVERDDAGYIDYIEAPLLNLGSLDISGVDLTTRFALTNSFSIQINHSQLFYYKNEGFPGTGFEDILGQNGYPSWRNNVTLNYRRKKLTISLNNVTIGEHEKAVAEEGMLESYTESHLNIGYAISRDTSATLGVQNIFKTIPPLDDSNATNQLNTSLYNPRGQSVFVGFQQRF